MSERSPALGTAPMLSTAQPSATMLARISAALMPVLLPAYGWRGAFVAFGAASIGLGILAILLLREPPPFLLARGKADAARRNAARVIDPSIELLPEAGKDRKSVV